MFEKLSLLWKGDAPLQSEFSQFVQMLILARDLYHLIMGGLHSGEKLKELETTVYQSDIKINKMEREIRKSLVTHLSINPGHQIAGSLILMSVVKDAERLGDFCKNLYEASVYWGQSDGKLFYAERINEFEQYVSDVFSDTIRAFETEDDILAAEIIQDEVHWNKRFDRFIGELVDSDIKTKEAVCTVLMIRSFKRLQAHLSNIASSVVLPVHRLDHRPKDLR